MLNIKEAKEELTNKSYKDIQTETTWKWGSRAAASYQNLIDTVNNHEKLMLSYLAEEYYHEAIEHAALVEDDGKLVKKFQQEIAELKAKAAENIHKALLGE